MGAGRSHQPCAAYSPLPREPTGPSQVFLNHLFTLEPSMTPHSLWRQVQIIIPAPEATPAFSPPGNTNARSPHLPNRHNHRVCSKERYENKIRNKSFA